MNPQVIHWLSACKALMISDPVSGATSYDHFIGKKKLDYELGWNRIHLGADKIHPVLYTFISESGGTTTPEKPSVNDEEIHDVTFSPTPFETTTLWYICMGHARQLMQLSESGYSYNYVSETMQAILNASNRERDFRQRGIKLIKVMALETSTGGGIIPKTRSEEIANQIVQDYLDLRISNFAASQLLDFVLTAKSVTHSLVPEIVWRSPGEWVELIDHFCDKTYSIFNDGKNSSLMKFFKLTYLGTLYASTGVLLTNHLRGLFPESGLNWTRMGKQAQRTEETKAHNGFPAYIVPAMLAYPEEGPRYIARYIGDRPIQPGNLLLSCHQSIRELILNWRKPDVKEFNLIREYHKIIEKEKDYLQDILSIYRPYPDSK